MAAAAAAHMSRDHPTHKRRQALFDSMTGMLANYNLRLFSHPIKDEKATTMLTWRHEGASYVISEIAKETQVEILSDLDLLLNIFHGINVKYSLFDSLHASARLQIVTTEAFQPPKPEEETFEKVENGDVN